MKRIEDLEREIESLKATVSLLQGQVEALCLDHMAGKGPVEALLWQRGASVLAHGDRTRVILPAGVTPRQTVRFYDLMRRYSFRLFLRELLQSPSGEGFGSLNRYCSEKVVRSYLAVLSELGVVRLLNGGRYELIPKHITSLGPTLEWYVSEVLQRELLAPALFNVRFRNTRYGGDYDVITFLAGRLVYVEVKSSPPRGVELPAISAFLNRLDDLQPQLAIFLVDTELRMRDKMAPLFAEALQARQGSGEAPAVTPLVAEVFHISHRIYIANSRKGIYSNLRLCIRDFFRWEGRSGQKDVS